MLLTDLQIAVPYVSTKFNPADAPTRGRAVRRAPAAWSDLARTLIACSFDANTDAAFMSSLRDVVSLSELLEPAGSNFEVISPLYFHQVGCESRRRAARGDNF